MLFDPRTFDAAIDLGGSDWSPERRAPAAASRSSDGFLTLPSLAADVPARGHVSYQDEQSFRPLVQAHFKAGPLLARDVRAPGNAGDAFAQAMFAWLRRRMPKCRRLNFGFALLDQSAAMAVVEQFGWEDQLTAPLYLAIELPQEEVYQLKASIEPLNAVHGSLLCTAMSLIDEASGHTLFIRTPGAMIEMFARRWWDYDEGISDDDAREHLKGWFDMSDEDAAHYLPSVVRPAIRPDVLMPEIGRKRRGQAKRRVLSTRELQSLADASRGWGREVCLAVIRLQASMRGLRRRGLFSNAQWAEPGYSAATVVVDAEEWAVELLDDHFQDLSNGGDATEYQMLIPLETERRAIVRQYERLARAFEIIAALDRLLFLISK